MLLGCRNSSVEVGRGGKEARKGGRSMKNHLRDHPWMEKLIPAFEGLSPVSINAIGRVLADYEKRHPDIRVSGEEARTLAEKCVEAMEEACAEAMYGSMAARDKA
jgi:hypothetical protein